MSETWRELWRCAAAPVVAVAITATAACGPDGPIELPEALPGPSPVEFPAELWDMGLEGETLLMVHVTESGTVDSVFVERSSGFEDFDSAAVQGGRRMRFAPGRQDGERIAVWTRVPVRFSLDARRDEESELPTGETGQENR